MIYAIWWLDESECRLILDSLAVGLPTYIVQEMDSMRGRPKRGRLWIHRGIPSFDISPDNPTLKTDFISTRGGLVIYAEHDIFAYGRPGYLTDAELQPWAPLGVMTAWDGPVSRR